MRSTLASNFADSWSINPLGFVTSYVYDLANRQQELTNPENETTTSVYYADGQLKAAINPLNHRTSYVYDKANRRIEAENARGFVTTTTYYPDGQAKATIDPLDHRTTTTYDLANRPQTVTNPRGFVTTTTYYADGQAKEAIDASGFRTTTTYDKANRPKTVTNARGTVTTSTYYTDGQLKNTFLPLAGRTTNTYDLANRLSRATNAASESTTSTYYADGQLKETIDPLDHRTTYTYDAANRRISAPDAENQRTSTIYDDAGRTIAEVDALAQRVTYTYDQADRRIELTDVRGNVTTFLFDDAGRDTGSIDPLARRVTFTYDPAGNRLTKRDPRGNITTFSYDGANLLRTHLASDGVRYTFTYDPANNRALAETTHGRYTTIYSARNEVARTVNADDKGITYTYDAVGDRATMIDPDGGRFTYTHDARRRLSTVINALAERTTLTYDQADREQSRSLANEAGIGRTYDPAGRNTVITYSPPGGGTLAAFTYTYDNTNHRKQALDSFGGVVTWTYDPKYQLSNERRSGTNSYHTTHVYDPAGNRTVQIDGGARTTYTYDVANQLNKEDTAGAVTTYVYDASGNRTSKETPTATTFYSWDSACRMTTAEPVSGAITYVYDADHLRVRKITGAEEIRFINDFQKVLQETDDAGDMTAEYTTSTQEFGNLLSEFGTDSTFPLPDAVGNTAYTLDGAGNIDDTYIYKAFGEIVDHSGSSESPMTYVGQLGYYAEPDIDQYYVRRRYYDPAAARFTAEDPRGYPRPGEPDEVNLYLYGFNDPVNRVDPSGLEETWLGRALGVLPGLRLPAKIPCEVPAPGPPKPPPPPGTPRIEPEKKSPIYDPQRRVWLDPDCLKAMTPPPNTEARSPAPAVPDLNALADITGGTFRAGSFPRTKAGRVLLDQGMQLNAAMEGPVELLRDPALYLQQAGQAVTGLVKGGLRAIWGTVELAGRGLEISVNPWELRKEALAGLNIASTIFSHPGGPVDGLNSLIADTAKQVFKPFIEGDIEGQGALIGEILVGLALGPELIFDDLLPLLKGLGGVDDAARAGKGLPGVLPGSGVLDSLPGSKLLDDLFPSATPRVPSGKAPVVPRPPTPPKIPAAVPSPAPMPRRVPGVKPPSPAPMPPRAPTSEPARSPTKTPPVEQPTPAPVRSKAPPVEQPGRSSTPDVPAAAIADTPIDTYQKARFDPQGPGAKLAATAGDASGSGHRLNLYDTPGGPPKLVICTSCADVVKYCDEALKRPNLPTELEGKYKALRADAQKILDAPQKPTNTELKDAFDKLKAKYPDVVDEIEKADNTFEQAARGLNIPAAPLKKA